MRRSTILHRIIRVSLFAITLVSYAGTYASPIGTEFLVNTKSDGNQFWPDSDMLENGNFIVAYHTDSADVAAQLFDSLGNPIGAEIDVRLTVGNDNSRPAVDFDASGNFVVTWQDFGEDGSGYGIFAQRFNSSGVAQGGIIFVNTTTNDGQRNNDIAVANDGSFLVAWEDDTVGTNKRGIRAQLFNASGVAQGGELTVSEDVLIDHSFPKVAHDDNGNFVVAWAAGDGGANKDVVFRRISSAGALQGSTVQANVTSKMAHASGTTNNMSVGMDADGNIYLVWRADEFSGGGVPGSGLGLFARRYTSGGVAIGDPFVIDEDTASDAPEIAVAGNGDFAVAYLRQDGSLSGPWVRRFHANGQPKELPFQANQTVQSTQNQPTVAIDGLDRGVVAWRETVNDRDGDGDSIWARTFRLQPASLMALPDTDNSGLSEVGALRLNQATNRGRIQLRDTDYSIRNTFNLLSTLVPLKAHPVQDLNADQIPDIAVYSRRASDDRAMVEMRDPSDGSLHDTLAYWVGYTPLNISINMGDTNSNGADEILAFIKRASDDRVVAQLRDLGAKSLVANVWLPPMEWPIDAVKLIDVNGSNVDDVAILTRHMGTNRNRIKVYEGSTGAHIKTTLLPPTVYAQEIESTADVTGNGKADLVVLVTRTDDEELGVRVHDGFNGQLQKVIWFGDEVEALPTPALAITADSNGNGSPEIALLMRQTSDQTYILQTREISDKSLFVDVTLPTGYTPENAVIFSAFSGNVDAIATFGFTAATKSQAQVFTAENGSEVFKRLFALP